jgi:hypothetical protein
MEVQQRTFCFGYAWLPDPIAPWRMIPSQGGIWFASPDECFASVRGEIDAWYAARADRALTVVK